MYWFWAVTRHLWPHIPSHCKFRVLEIGVYQAGNTLQLLNHYPHMELVSVDPTPPENLERIREEFGDRFSFVEGLSLDYLDTLEEDFDLVLIDGDHNRYTVYNELKLLFENQNQFPIVILHDVHKPYGRRDYAYNPNNLPEGELNRARSGVLSGVEDFINEYTIEDDTDFRMFKLTLYPYGPGLGVLSLVDNRIVLGGISDE